jgi:RHH-type transcriptional regulator, proline utilization regulon repressor / proline dehydrogenase / delta 1-pyrroline-5-carboxylate dehydrogenase
MDIEYKISKSYESSSNKYTKKIEKKLTKSDIFKEQCETTIKYISNFAYWNEVEFEKEHDYSNIRGESNIIRYIPVKNVLLRIEENDSLEDILTSIIVIKMIGANLDISIPKDSKKEEFTWLESNQKQFIDKNDSFSKDSEDELIMKIPSFQRVRFLKPDNVTKNIYKAISDKAIYIASDKFIPHGRLELMHYFIEQSISNSYHRYGNLGEQGLKKLIFNLCIIKLKA